MNIYGTWPKVMNNYLSTHFACRCRFLVAYNFRR